MPVPLQSYYYFKETHQDDKGTKHFLCDLIYFKAYSMNSDNSQIIKIAVTPIMIVANE